MCIRDRDRKDHAVGVPFAGKYTEILNSDAEQFGGKNRINEKVLEADERPANGRELSVSIRQAPLSVSIFSYTPYTKEEQEARRRAKEEAAKKAQPAASKSSKRRRAGKGKKKA